MLKFPKQTPGWRAWEWCWGLDSLDWLAWSWDLYWHRCRWFAAQIGMSVWFFLILLAWHQMLGNVWNPKSQHVPTPTMWSLVFHGFSWFVCLQITEYHRIDEQRLQLGEAFQHLAVAPGDLHDLFFRQWSLHFDWRRKKPENDRKAIYVVMICNVYIYIYICILHYMAIYHYVRLIQTMSMRNE